jgi:hypothetical protein
MMTSHDLKLSQDSIKSSRAINRVITSLMMRNDVVLGTSVSFIHLKLREKMLLKPDDVISFRSESKVGTERWRIIIVFSFLQLIVLMSTDAHKIRLLGMKRKRGFVVSYFMYIYIYISTRSSFSVWRRNNRQCLSII